ncbi:MAG: sulfatase-like hydrolase/transferase [Bryobacteraceae bacterium]|nr:sulfatase-like hydrolase/transferase [Bryobacteraceae bacterium]
MLPRRRFLQLLPAAALAQPAPRPRNVIVIVTDDQGIGDLGCYGDPDARTPHLDGLAARGIRFTQWYSNAPICSASRAALLTGKYPDRTGVKGALQSSPAFNIPGLRDGELTFPKWFQKRGYRTALLGKWHLGSVSHSRPRAQGFDEFFGWYSGWLDAYSHRYYQMNGSFIFHDLWRDDQEVFEEPAYMTELLGREAAGFLSRQSARQPFYLQLCFGAPHYSMMAPRKYLERFPAAMDRDRREHLAMVGAVDDVVGSLLRQLKTQGLEDSTIIAFLSDNGATREVRASSSGKPYAGGSNGRRRGYKQGLFDGGINVPAILRAPGQQPRTWERPVLTMDLLPTLLALADPAAAPPAGIDGHNFLGAQPEHERMFWSFEKSRAVRAGDWKLILNPPDFPGEEVRTDLWLSNLESDPGERTNFAASEPERVRRMTEWIREWERSL